MKELAGSFHPLTDATLIGRAAPSQKIAITVKLRPETDGKVYNDVKTLLQKNGFLAGQMNLTRNTVEAVGSVYNIEKTFGVTLFNHHKDGHVMRQHDTPLQVPDELAAHVTAVLGVSDTFRAKPHFRRMLAHPNASQKSYYPEQLAAHYNFPKGDGAGQTVGIIELGGGYVLSDLNEYAMSRGLPLPNIQAVNVGGGSNSPGDDADGEVCLDVEIIASIVPKAKIVVYFADNTDQGFSNAIAAAVNCIGMGAISISWGTIETQYSAQAIASFEQDFAKAVSKGINVFVSSGDNGSSDGGHGNNVDYPGSSPNVVCCGGTEIEANGQEVVWNDAGGNGATGGGVSVLFKKPGFQSNLNAEDVEYTYELDEQGRPRPIKPRPRPTPNGNMRNTPDIAANASPNSGWIISVNGTQGVIGGTSSDSPCFAALNVLLNQALGRNVGWINPLFYKHYQAFNDITVGNNGAYAAKSGFDNCTGIGTPNGEKLLTALK